MLIWSAISVGERLKSTASLSQLYISRVERIEVAKFETPQLVQLNYRKVYVLGNTSS